MKQLIFNSAKELCQYVEVDQYVIIRVNSRSNNTGAPNILYARCGREVDTIYSQNHPIYHSVGAWETNYKGKFELIAILGEESWGFGPVPINNFDKLEVGDSVFLPHKVKRKLTNDIQVEPIDNLFINKKDLDK